MARILIIDDNHLGLVARKSVLEAEGHTVEISSSPQQAIEICEQKTFDVVITDYKMPRVSGIDVIQQVKKAAAPPAIILLSGFADALGLNEANTGADAVLQKSANEVSQLIRTVNRVLRKPVSKKKPAERCSTIIQKRSGS